MRHSVFAPLMLGLSGIVSWSIVLKYRKAWGRELGPYAICARLLKEDKAWGSALIVSQFVGLAVTAYLLYLVNR